MDLPVLRELMADVQATTMLARRGCLDVQALDLFIQPFQQLAVPVLMECRRLPALAPRRSPRAVSFPEQPADFLVRFDPGRCRAGVPEDGERGGHLAGVRILHGRKRAALVGQSPEVTAGHPFLDLLFGDAPPVPWRRVSAISIGSSLGHERKSRRALVYHAPMDWAIVLIVILLLVLLWRGPKMLPRLGESLGQAVRGARRAADEAWELDRPRDPPDTPADRP